MGEAFRQIFLLLAADYLPNDSPLLGTNIKYTALAYSVSLEAFS